MVETFTVGEVLKKGWELFKVNLGFLISYQLVMYVILALMVATQGIWHFLIWVCALLVKMGFVYSCILITRGLKPDFDQLYKHWRLFLSWVIANFLFAVMFTIGLVLFVVPGLYVLARFGMYPFFLVDKNLGPIEALSQASKSTEGQRWPIFVLFMAVIGLDILGFLFFGVGEFITVPVTSLALAVVYNKLINYKKTVEIEV